MADELEADLPSDGNGNGDDEVAQARTARERARRLGWGGLIRGFGAAVAMLAIGRWLQERALPAAVLLAGGAAAGGVALAPAVAPHIPGMPVIGSRQGAAPAPTVTRTVAGPPRPGPTRTVTISPSPSPSSALTPDGSPGPAASSRPTPSPSPAGGAAPAPSGSPAGGQGGRDGGGADAPPPSGPPAVTEPMPEPEADPASCVLGVALPPLPGLCVLGGGGA